MINNKLYPQSIRLIYTLLHYFALPVILVRLLWLSRQNSGYRRRWNERFGYIKRVKKNCTSIWVHAVSVGESLAAIPLIKMLQKKYPNYNIVVTTTTPTGSAQVVKHLKNQVMHVYTPYDVPSCVNRFLRRSNTKFCIIMETEMWPNLLHCCQKRDIPVMLANGRMSERSKHSYQTIASLTRLMLRSYRIVVAQGLLDGERLLSLGLDPKQLIVSGNIKFDITLENNLLINGKKLRLQWQSHNRPTFIAASTHEGEEQKILQAFNLIRKEIENALLIIVPRHPERFAKVIQLCKQQGFTVTTRSSNKTVTEETNIFIGDSMGELKLFYAASDVAFVGGSLVNTGGHNLIEPAAIGLPILTGPHLYNFATISKLLLDAGAAQTVSSPKALAKMVISLFSSPDLCRQMGKEAKKVIENNKGALAKHMEWIEKIFPSPNTPRQKNVIEITTTQ